MFSDLSEFKEEKAKASALKATAYANVAAVKLKEKDWSAVVEQSTKALELEPKNPKVLFRRAQAQAHRGENPLALEDIKQALEIQPNNAPIIKLRNAIQTRITKEKEKEKKLFGGFFNKVRLVDDIDVPTPAPTEVEKNENTSNTDNTEPQNTVTTDQINEAASNTISNPTTSSNKDSLETKGESKVVETKDNSNQSNNEAEETVSPKDAVPESVSPKKAPKKKVNKKSKPKAQKSKPDSGSSGKKVPQKAKKEKSK